MLWLLFLFADPAQLIERGVAALDANDLPAARASFENATRIAPGSAPAWMMLAQTLGRQGDLAGARTAADKAERYGAKDPAILQGLANFHGSVLRDLPRAAGLGARYAELAPRDTTAWRRVAALYLAIGKPEEAIAAGVRGKARDGGAELRMILGKAYAARKEWAKAGSEFAEATRLNPYDEETWFAAAQAHLLRQDFAGAEQVLLDARKTFDRSPQIELTLGVAYYGQRKFADAVDRFLFTTRLAPDLPQPYAFLGRVLEHTGDRLAEATERFAAFEQRNPRSPLGYLLHAKAIIAQLGPSGFPAEAGTALELVEKALALEEADADAQFQMGVLLARKGDPGAAASHLERSIQLNARDSAAHFQLARVYARLGRKEDAARERALHEQLSERENAAPPSIQGPAR